MQSINLLKAGKSFIPAKYSISVATSKIVLIRLIKSRLMQLLGIL